MAISDDIKARLDIVDVVAQHVPDLKKAGRNFAACCPFHQERTPSFVVFPERQTWRCFGACATGGDLFTFVMKMENLEFSDALKLLARQAGVPMAERRRDQAPRHPLLAVNESALRFFRESLAADRGSLARDYLEERDISDESVDRFGLGYSPSTGYELMRHATSLGVTAEDLLAAGLVVRSEDGSTRDMFRGRLMFAIRDAQGGVVGFAGRALDGSNPKYLNTPQTVLFDKGRLLYGMDQVGESVAPEEMVVVEGYTDVIAAHQHGYRNVVASMGTALTEHQVSLLRGHARSFVLAMDPDNAGQEATMRSLESSWNIFGGQQASGRRGSRVGLFQRPEDLQALRIAVLPDGLDPDALIRRDPARWLQVIGDAVPVVDYLFEGLVRRTDLDSSEAKAQLAQRLFPLIAAMQNPYDQDRYFQRLAVLLGVSTATLEASVGQPRLAQEGRRQARLAVSQAAVSPFRQADADPLEEYALTLMLHYPRLRARAAELPEEHVRRHENKALLNAIRETGTMELDSVNPPGELGEHWERLLDRELPSADHQKQEEDFAACLRRLEERHLRELKSQEEVVLAHSPDDNPIQDEQITAVNQRLKELFRRDV